MNKEIEVLYARENKDVIIPTKDKENAGYDIYVDPKWLLEEHGGELFIEPLETVMIPTGLRMVLPITHYIQIAERGSTGSKGMKYSAGIGDSRYLGEYNVFITNCSNKTIMLTNKPVTEKTCEKFTVYPSDKGIAQFMIKRVEKARFKEITKDELLNLDSIRKDGKLGSSGK